MMGSDDSIECCHYDKALKDPKLELDAIRDSNCPYEIKQLAEFFTNYPFPEL
jgi:hypothetical protein